METTWTLDAPSGVYKNHTLSSMLRFAAIAETKFMQFVKAESGYGRNKGESVTITRVSNIDEATNPRIGELEDIPEDVLSISTKAITVVEWGRAVPYTNLNQELSKFNIESTIQKKLKDNMSLSLDTGCADAFTSSDVKLKFVPTGVASYNLATTGTAGAQALANLNTYHVESIRDLMFGTYKMPAYEGGEYICILSTKAKRGIVNDPHWETWHKYTDPQSKYNGEIGRYENIRFIETNHFQALSNGIGSGSVCGEAVFFGDEAVAMAIVKDPELLAKIPQKYGRDKGVAWYGIMEFGVIWDTANAGEARIIHVTST